MPESEAEGQTSSKKRRLAEATSTILSPCRSVKFWFEDGTVVLQAEALRFRIHRGVLSANSTFFADMFKLPQPQNEPLVDGCSLVHVHETAEEWEDMLTMLYDPLRTQKLLGTLPFPFLRALLRLGTKYQFDAIRDRALEHFKSMFPDKKPMSWYSLHTGKIVVDSLNLAVELGIQTVLPLLYYTCCAKLTMKQILDGVLREDKSVARLSSRAQRSVLLGRDCLRSTLMTDACAWLDTPHCIDCTDRRECREYVDNARREMLNMSIGMLNAYGSVSLSPKSNMFCAFCLPEALKLQDAGRKAFYDALPGCFDLPNWEDLRDDVLE